MGIIRLAISMYKRIQTFFVFVCARVAVCALSLGAQDFANKHATSLPGDGETEYSQIYDHIYLQNLSSIFLFQFFIVKKHKREKQVQTTHCIVAVGHARFIRLFSTIPIICGVGLTIYNPLQIAMALKISKVFIIKFDDHN